MKKNISIQILRCIAATIVVAAHSISTYQSKIKNESVVLENFGFFGVIIFFTISGYIIFETTRNLSGKKDAFRFLKKRCYRIIPIYWLAVILYIFKQNLLGIYFPIEEVVMSLVFLPYVNSNGFVQPILGIGWTLNYEMFFYAIFSFFILFKVNYRFYLCILFFFLFFLLFNNNGVGYLEGKTFGYQLIATEYLFYFLVGCLLSFFKPLVSVRFSLSLVLLICYVLIFLYFFLLDSFVNMQLFFIINSMFVFLIIGVCVLEKKTAWVNCSKFLIVLYESGNSSFSTYLFHGFVIGFFARLINYFDLKFSIFLYVALMVLLSNLVGFVVYSLVEKPVLKKLT